MCKNPAHLIASLHLANPYSDTFYGREEAGKEQWSSERSATRPT